MSIGHWLESKTGKKVMNYVNCWGATVVIIGAMFKIQHWPGASVVLVIGLSTEAVIFFLAGLIPVHEDAVNWDWGKVYPQLVNDMGDGFDDNAGIETGGGAGRIGGGSGISIELDRMLEEAKIGPELLESLGDGMRSLSDSASKLGNIADASVATTEYATQIKGATHSMTQFAASSAKAAESMGSLSVSSEEAKAYNEHLADASRNMGALNAAYELQLENTKAYLNSSEVFFNGMSQLVGNMTESLEQTKTYKQEITNLNKNLSALNTIYGNMLAAMTVSRS